MTMTIMKCLALPFSITFAAALAGSTVLSAPCALASAVAGPSAPLPDDVAGQTKKAATFPTFCQIPSRPTNVRTGKAYKEAVVAIRLEGVRLVAQTAPGTFSLNDTDRFASAARSEAVPPPPMTPSDDQQTEAFIDRARALARPPGPR
jgi:hypothetical protein